jgi:hypothetical protein
MKTAALPFSESALQAQVAAYLDRFIRPGLRWSAIENGGKRHLLTAVRLKKNGVKAGTPDIFVMMPEGRIAWLELKIKGGALSLPQKEFRDTAKRLGHHWAIAKTLDEAIVYLGGIGILKNYPSKANQQKEKASGT